MASIKTKAVVPLPRPEYVERHVLRRRRKREVAEVFVLAMGAHHERKLRLGRVDVVLVDLLPRLRLVFRDGLRQIAQRDLELRRALTRLAGMRLVDYDGEAFACDALDVLEDDRELLQCRNDDPLAVIDGGKEVFSVLLLVDDGHFAKLRVETHNRALQLLVKDTSVRHDDHRVEDGLVVVVEEACKAIADPRN